MSHHLLAATLAALTLCAAAGGASAHDTWFDSTGPQDPLRLGTGSVYPRFETGIDARYLAQQGCSAEAGPVRPMRALRNDDDALVLRPPPAARTCWAQLQPFDIELPADKVAVYLQEIQASTGVRQAWAALQARGLPWRERYVKHARIEFETPSSAPAPLGLDLQIETGGRALQVGQPLQVRALRDGQPLAGLPLQLRSDRTPLGIWRVTDAQGRVQMPLPLAGSWLLRGVDLRLSADDPQRWDSRFVTLAFEVPADQNTRTSKALSASQTVATAAISSDPPVSTTTR